ncbi:rsbT co-antagonist protein RsbR [Marinococcus luteus]|uniref:RsbT co-antagonist protein RsbR n=1 Tax=Marinococcus luteus TaxID=1122204 RepID=A0A1H2TSF5_9BACI|nr:STAS domain-containing protein [Marinococcus luteus]SDW46209.1 rsbT co-antagonist protein RsbR [Marinococcus luteus]
MSTNQLIRDYFVNHAAEMANSWYETLEESDRESAYATTDPKEAEELKSQTYEFHLYFSSIFIEDRNTWENTFEVWIDGIINDPKYFRTKDARVVREMMRYREQYTAYLKRFYAEEHTGLSANMKEQLRELVTNGVDQIILSYVEKSNRLFLQKLEAKESIINELSAPVISLNKSSALLPLIGEIDEERAAVILEHSLEACSKKQVSELFIDLSGVAGIDTHVAHQIFGLIRSLKLIGVQPVLAGMRPEIAQTSVHLGISFQDVPIASSLAQAMDQKY